MSFAQFVLSKIKTEVVTVEKEIEEVVRKRKRAPRRMLPLATQHFPRCPGITRTEYGWAVFKNVKQDDRCFVVRIGDSFESFVRARASQKLYNYWLKSGFVPGEIPVKISKTFRGNSKRRLWDEAQNN